MINLIKSDLYRIFKGKGIYIVFTIIFLMLLVDCISMSAGAVGISVENLNMDAEFLSKVSKASSLTEYRDIMKSYTTFELDKSILGNNDNLYYFFIPIVVFVITTDFSNKSIKNTLSSAITRKKYYFSKLLLVLGLGTVIILFNNYSTYLLNLIINGRNFASSFLEITKLTFLQLPLLYGIMSLLVGFAFALKKTSLFNTISIPFIIILQMIFMGITNLFKIKLDWFYNYELHYALTKLVKNPTEEYIIKVCFLGIAYIVIFNIIGYYIFKKSEIK